MDDGQLTSTAVFLRAEWLPQLWRHEQDGAFGDDTGWQDDNERQQVGHHFEAFDGEFDYSLIG